MKADYLVPSFTDARGKITDIIDDGHVQHVALMESAPGAIRGNHYHKTATEHVLVLDGALRIRCRPVDSSEVTEIIVAANDLVAIPPREVISLEALRRTRFITFISDCPDGGRLYLNDTVRENV